MIESLGRTLQRIDRATGAAKRTQGVQPPRDRASKAHSSGVSVVRQGGRSTCTPYGLSVKVPPGSKERSGLHTWHSSATTTKAAAPKGRINIQV